MTYVLKTVEANEMAKDLNHDEIGLILLLMEHTLVSLFLGIIHNEK